jgi:hypothetical protein
MYDFDAVTGLHAMARIGATRKDFSVYFHREFAFMQTESRY